jgi:putative membrane protein
MPISGSCGHRLGSPSDRAGFSESSDSPQTGAYLAVISNCRFEAIRIDLRQLEELSMNLSPIVVAVASVFVFPVASMSAQGVSDAQIASIVVTANQVDIDAGKLASSRSTSSEVKAFGELMVTDHTGVNKAATELATKLNVKPEDNPTSQSLKADGEKNLAQLKTLTGAAFDKAYIEHEVAYHQQVIDALDKTLIPSATNAELKALLVKVRPAFVAHLEHAKRLQASSSHKS